MYTLGQVPDPRQGPIQYKIPEEGPITSHEVPLSPPVRTGMTEGEALSTLGTIFTVGTIAVIWLVFKIFK